MKKIEGLTVIPTDTAPANARLVDDFTPSLIDVGAHNLCPGCGEPIAMRSLLEIVEELTVIDRSIAVFGIGCYTAFSNNLDCEVLLPNDASATLRELLPNAWLEQLLVQKRA